MLKSLTEICTRRKSVLSIGTSLKMMYFSYNLSISLLQPFMPVMLKMINFSNFEIGMTTMSGVLAGVVSSLAITILADKTKKHRVLQIITTIASITFLTVPIFLLDLRIGERSVEEKAYIKLFNVTQQQNYFLNLLSSHTNTFWFMTIFFTLHNSADVCTKCLMEAVTYGTIKSVKDIEGDVLIYSNQRIFFSLGSGIAGIITGMLVDHMKTSWPIEYFLISIAILFGIVEILCVVFVIPSFQHNVTVKTKGSIIGMLKNWDLNMLLLTNGVYNITIGAVKTFDPLYIIQMGGNRLLIGICFCTGYMSDIMAMKMSPMFFALLGGPSVLVPIGMFIYLIRSLTYAYADSKFMAIEYSFRNGFLYGFLWPTFSNHVYELAPRPMVNTYLSILFAIGKLGSMVGLLIGGLLIDKKGFKITLLVVSSISAFWLLVTVSYYGYRRWARRKFDEYHLALTASASASANSSSFRTSVN